MRIIDYLNRSMDRLTVVEWDRMLITRSAGRQVMASIGCPYCGSVVAVGVAIRPVAEAIEPRDISPSALAVDPAADRHVELPAMVEADFAPA
jgi:hypothetical protein